ncbi:type I pullulanase [Mesobacillus zeae]|uniref:Type I pullulanase n=1 Tax=Mesobacillus zeae TaxID=1917180 RepID=A0A398AZT3_9BACI|nr:type I pullulanase [Mesobacillus zeae]RID83085.1 type I pullulanase [Mesobacillus zeae]
MTAIDRKFHAYLDELQTITVLLPYTYHNGLSSRLILTDGSESIDLDIRQIVELPDFQKYICHTPVPPQIGHSHWIDDEHGNRTDLQIGAVIRSTHFDKAFFYDGELGINYSKEKTVFKVWAPTATQLKIKLLPHESGTSELRSMKREAKGVWSLTVEGNLELFRYSYLACINLVWNEAVDPFAMASTVNGEYGVVVDMPKTSIQASRFPFNSNPCDAVIYEVHIRDLSIHESSGASKKGTYRGATETRTVSGSGVETGLSYIKNLGVTHLEFLPFNDFGGVNELKPMEQYNWGYNPIHFNVPEGSFSTDPQDPYCRITELKHLIESVHSLGMRVIMDVVYNHVYIREESSFERLVPGYFFRHDQHGMPSNGTGVGNDFASERLMARKFILDSVTFWMEEYNVDGFRFDLMGILDIETMQAVRAAVDKIDPSAIVIGEGWDLNTPILMEQKANIRNQQKLPRIGQFNDWFRDTIKGSTFNLYDRGYVLGNDRCTESAKQTLVGSIGIGRRKNGLFSEPGQSVNYVESHDNHTLWDKLASLDPDEDEVIRKKRHRLATSIVLLSQGIPFLHAGQEFFRTKKGIGNSYRSPNSINQLDWELRDENMDNIEFLKGIISIRMSHQAFRLPDAGSVRKYTQFMTLPPPLIGYWLHEVGEFGNWDELAVFFNPSLERHTVEFPLQGKWNILADWNAASCDPIRQSDGRLSELEPCSLLIAAK